MGFSLVLSEKRDTAERIAKALDENKGPRSCWDHGIPYFEAINQGQILRIVPATGHLYTIAPKERGYHYPVLDVEWAPAYRFNKRLAHTKQWIEAIERLSQGASAFISATDYDLEGEVIGYTILRFACKMKEKQAKRMVFSTLTRTELQKAFHDLSPTIDFKLAEAGETRHIIDFLWGINVSRALTLSLRRAGEGFTKLSAGRVQGPTLRFIAEREKEINSFVPTPYWRISATLEADGQLYGADYIESKIETCNEAQMIVEHCHQKEGVVKDIASRTYEECPPPPFNLTNLQSESYRIFRYSPSQTLKIAEKLYLGALISYPRTSSEKLPPSLDYEEILTSLSKSERYKELASVILRTRRLRPRQGREEDPAHPAIYPTGNLPESLLDNKNARLLDLIIHRFLSVFAAPAMNENVQISIDLNGEVFILAGRRILREGWLRFYGRYGRREEKSLPVLNKGQRIQVNEIACNKTFTPPPSRFNPASLLKEMEKHELGTKATRADIIDTLNKRGYVSGERIVATDLGLSVYDALQKYCPSLVSVEFTRELERKIEAIQKGENGKQQVVEEASLRLTNILEHFKSNEEAIALSLFDTLQSPNSLERIIGPCPICGKGELQIIRSKRTGKRFVGCTNYRDGNCTATFPLPQPPYKIWTTDLPCQICRWPKVKVKSPSKRRPWSLCLNPSCPTKISRKQP